MAYDHPERRRERDFSFQTTWNVEHYEVTWTLERFSWLQSLYKDGHRSMTTRVFRADPGDGIKWCLTVYPNGNPEMQESNVGCFLTLLQKDVEMVRVKCTFHGMDGFSNTLFREELQHTFKEPGQQGVYKALNSEDIDLIKADDVFKLTVNFVACSGPVTEYEGREVLTPQDDADSDSKESD